MYQFLYRHLLARIDAETAHHLALVLLRTAGGFAAGRSALRAAFSPDVEGLAMRAFGLEFAHPLGLAAGFDKNAVCVPALSALGFSFVEVGTVTPRPQPGNPRPRLFRLLEDSALINWLGFPGAGMEAVARNLQELTSPPARDRFTVPAAGGEGESVGVHRSGLETRPRCVVGISLGKNKDTPLEDAHKDYSAVLERLYSLAEFFVINVSSPNTPDLRKLQTREYLSELLKEVVGTLDRCAAYVQAEQAGGLSHRLNETALGFSTGLKPRASPALLVKIAPDLTFDEIDTLLDLAVAHGISGIIATNTTTARAGLLSPHRDESGGLSGVPLRARSTEIIRHIYRQTSGRLPIIGVGGIFTGDDAWEKLAAGATLLQAYTGFIDRGPAFVRQVTARLREKMREAGVNSLSEIVGASAK